MTEKLTIIDGSGYIFRAFYAIQRLSTSKGFPTNAIYGFINMLARVLEVEKPTKLIIAFDTPKPTFRKKLYDEYKANRLAPPDDLVKQIPLIFRAVDCFGVRRVEMEGFEADDIIATVAKKAEQDGYKVEIITGDKDLMQLVNENVTLYDTMKDKRIDIPGVAERFGVTPAQVVDLLALMGDSSDNIPGVSGIGEKTAVELIKQFGSLDGIYESLDQIKGKRRETLEKERDIAFLSRDLARVRYDVPVDIEWEQMSYRGPKAEELRKLCEELEFQGLIKRFNLKTEETNFKKGKYTVVATEDALKAAVEQLSHCNYLSLDTETTSLTIHEANLVGISMCGCEGEAFYVPVGHHAPGDPAQRALGQLDEEIVRRTLKPLFENPQVKKIGQNLKYDLQILRRFGIELEGIAADTLLESYLIDPEQPHNLDSLAFRHLGHQNITYEEVTGTGRSQISFAEVAIEKATDYSGEDADVAFRLHEKLYPELEKLGLAPLFHEIELPLLKVLADMEYLGVLVDGERLGEMSVGLQKEMGQVEERIYKLAGEPLNLNSPKQLAKILFEKLGLPIVKKTKTGISTDESVLQTLAGNHEICRWIVKFRELAKLRSTYVEGLLDQIHRETGRVHTNYNQTVAATGRLSSSNPNLQNIPTSDEGPYDIRSVFIAPKGRLLCSADYSQVELRLLAHMSQDPELTRAFREGEDVHRHTARLIFGESGDSPEYRRVAKAINFGVVYGQSPYGLSQVLKISTTDAKAFIDTYFARYSGVKTFLQRTIEEARAKGYVTTLKGRRRYFPEIGSKNRMRREMAERAAINAPVQGTAADMIKIAMVSLHRRLQTEGFEARMILQVHDELVLEVPAGEKDRIEKIVCEEMESALPLSVPAKVDLGWGTSWAEAK